MVLRKTGTIAREKKKNKKYNLECDDRDYDDLFQLCARKFCDQHKWPFYLS
jgi:hypothetical protein